MQSLAVAIVVASVVTFTLSMWLTVLFAEAVSGPVTRLRDATRAVARGDYDVHVPVVSSDETGQLAGAFNEMVGGLRERERLRHAFGAFVDPTLTERVLEEGVDLRGEEVEVSVFFLDVRGFTAFAETATPQDVVARLNELFEAVVPVIHRHGGHANKFIGDGLLAVFGAPDPYPDHAERAVAAALEIAGCAPLPVGVGVNTGPVVVGTIGGGGRVDFTVIGDTVNTAARIEAATRETGDDVLIAETTLGALSERSGWLPRPPVALKGKARAVALFAPGPPSRAPA
jgi:adenylate cyclase